MVLFQSGGNFSLVNKGFVAVPPELVRFSIWYDPNANSAALASVIDVDYFSPIASSDMYFTMYNDIEAPWSSFVSCFHHTSTQHPTYGISILMAEAILMKSPIQICQTCPSLR